MASWGPEVGAGLVFVSGGVAGGVRVIPELRVWSRQHVREPFGI